MPASVAIIIPTLDSPTLGDVIVAVQAQLSGVGRDIDLLVVGRDEARAAVRAGVRHVPGDRLLNPAEARNLGIRSTTADYLIFLDSDCIPEPGWLVAMLKHQSDELVLVSGAMHLIPDRYLRLAGNVSTFHEYTTALPASERPFLPTFSLGVSRLAVARQGGFDERLLRAEDLDFTIRLKRAGYQLIFDPSAAIVHRPSRLTVGGLIDHSILSGQCSIRVRRHYPDAFQMPRIMLEWQILLIGAPAVAVWVTAQAWTRNPDVRRFWSALPVVVLTRYLWIIGACQALREDTKS